jgi:peptide chain release factor 2
MELEASSSQNTFWDDAEGARDILQKIAGLKDKVAQYNELVSLHENLEVYLELLSSGEDSELVKELCNSLQVLSTKIEALEFFCKMRGKFDSELAIVEVKSGAGGTEAQDWGEMLLRLYLRWCEKKGFEVEELDLQPGEVAGIKSATIYVKAPYAYGYLRGEQGVHRLVRISPFDSNARRHTSFASVSVTPDIEDSVEVEIDEKDLRIDTYRSSGAGGQHVNKTDSAVRITHLPSGIVVACQNERSQHKNKARALKILKARLYEREVAAQQETINEIKGERMKIDFGSQIRSYVLQPYQLIKDLRTSYETSSVQDVLDGNIDGFIEAYLLQE